MKIIKGNQESYKKLKKVLESNNPIIVPTDTNYNFCCLPNDKAAIDRIFEYKIRPKNKPLSIFISNPNDWKKYGKTNHNELMEYLVDNFWPGALNIVIENNSNFNYAINGNKTISLGCVSNSIFKEFVEYVGGVVAITSANISGTADDILITEDIAKKQMGEKVKYLLQTKDKITNTKSSTIIKINENGNVSILRQGDISKKVLARTLTEGGYILED